MDIVLAAVAAITIMVMLVVDERLPRVIALLVLTLVLALSTQAHAATADLIHTDALGYQCVNEDDLESYWIAGESGKDPMRAPPICITDPCAHIESMDDMGWFWGRDLTQPEYIDYRYRMHGACGSPTFYQDRGIGDDQLTAFFFDGLPIGGYYIDPGDSAHVPLPPAGLLLACAITIMVITKRETSLRH